MLRLVHRGDPAPPGSGWLAVAGVVEAGVGLLWLVALARPLVLGHIDVIDPARDSLAPALGVAVYAVAMVVAGVRVAARRRWAWWLSLALAVTAIAGGFAVKAPVGIMVGGALLVCLLAGAGAAGAIFR